MAEGSKMVRVRGLGVKYLTLPHTDLGTPEKANKDGSVDRSVDTVKFDENGIAEVTPEVAEVLLDLYKHSVIRLG